jgi:hypothetical protein
LDIIFSLTLGGKFSTWTLLVLYFFFFFFGVLMFASFLLGRHFTSWAMLPALLFFGCFTDKMSDFCPGLTSDYCLPTYASHVAGIADMGHCLACLFRWVLANIFACLASNCHPLNLCLQKMTNTHHTLPDFRYFISAMIK